MSTPGMIVNSDGSGSTQNVTPGVFNGVVDSRTPSMIPRFDESVMDSNQQSIMYNTSDPEFINEFGQTAASGQAYIYGTNASGSATIGGTITATDVVTWTILSVNLSYTVLSTDTTSTVAAALAALVNNNATLSPNFTASSSGSVATASAIKTGAYPGGLGNTVTQSGSTSAGSTVTITVSGATFAGGGEVTTGDDVTLTVAGTPVSYTVEAADTAETTAANLASLVNGNSTLSPNFNASEAFANSNYYVEVQALPSGSFSGPAGNSASLAVSNTNTADYVNVSGASLSGGAGVIIPKVNFSWTHNGVFIWFQQNKPYIIKDQSLIAQLAAQNLI